MPSFQLKRILERTYPIYQPPYQYQKSLYATSTSPLYHDSDFDLIFGSPNSPNQLIDALALAKPRIANPLKENDSEVILNCLNQSKETIDVDHKNMLKLLPLFSRFDGKISSVGSAKVVILPDGIPVKGIEQLEIRRCCVFLKHNHQLEKLFDYLGFECLDWINFYQDYFTEELKSIENKDLGIHLEYLMRNVMLRSNGKELDKLIRKLSAVKLIPDGNGKRKLCCEMYDPNHPIFSMVLDRSNFPSNEYSSWNDWLPFLKKLGLIYEMNTELFIRFAKKLTMEEDLENVHKVSRLMCEELSNEIYLNDSFCNDIKRIKFIIPATIDEEYERMHASKNSTVDRISFHDSCVSTLESLAWTTKFILPSYTTECLKKKQFVSLDVISDGKEKEDVILTCAIENTKNISNAERNLRNVTETCKLILDEHLNGYHKALERFYGFLGNCESLVQEKMDTLKDVPFILVKDKTHLEIPRRSIFSEEMEISPYINAVPVTLGSFHQVLEVLGCSKPSQIHYIDALNVMCKVSTADKNVVHVNEVEIVKKTVCFLAKVLENSEGAIQINANDTVLYLPTNRFTSKDVSLTLSTEVLFVDDLHLEERLRNFECPLLIPEYGKELDPNDLVNATLMRRLPEAIRPKYLRKSIAEVLSNPEDEFKMQDNDHISVEIN